MSEHGCKWNCRSLVDEATGALLVSMRVAGAQAPIPINIIQYPYILCKHFFCIKVFRTFWGNVV